MRDRCLNPQAQCYEDYGGRGITICPQWLGEDGFQQFLSIMGPRPSPRHSLDRKNNDGPYSPENCRWATKQEQQRNRRACVVLTVDGVAKTLKEWVEERGLRYSRVYWRIWKGWPAKRALEMEP